MSAINRKIVYMLSKGFLRRGRLFRVNQKLNGYSGNQTTALLSETLRALILTRALIAETACQDEGLMQADYEQIL